MRKIPEDVRVEPRLVARARRRRRLVAGDRARAAGRERSTPRWSTALADLLHGAELRAAWITTVPSVRLSVHARPAGRAPRRHARRAATSSSLIRREQRPPQREMANAVQQAANVRGAFTVHRPPRPQGTGVLLDDTRSSGWTLAMVGGQLRRAGAERIVPVALGTLA